MASASRFKVVARAARFTALPLSMLSLPPSALLAPTAPTPLATTERASSEPPISTEPVLATKLMLPARASAPLADTSIAPLPMTMLPAPASAFKSPPGVVTSTVSKTLLRPASKVLEPAENSMPLFTLLAAPVAVRSSLPEASSTVPACSTRAPVKARLAALPYCFAVEVAALPLPSTRSKPVAVADAFDAPTATTRGAAITRFPRLCKAALFSNTAACEATNRASARPCSASAPAPKFTSPVPVLATALVALFAASTSRRPLPEARTTMRPVPAVLSMPASAPLELPMRTPPACTLNSAALPRTAMAPASSASAFWVALPNVVLP